MTQDFLGVEIDVRGAGDYVPKVDAKIRRIKETYRKDILKDKVWTALETTTVTSTKFGSICMTECEVNEGIE